jgi:hypothetical protein
MLGSRFEASRQRYEREQDEKKRKEQENKKQEHQKKEEENEELLRQMSKRDEQTKKEEEFISQQASAYLYGESVQRGFLKEGSKVLDILKIEPKLVFHFNLRFIRSCRLHVVTNVLGPLYTMYLNREASYFKVNSGGKNGYMVDTFKSANTFMHIDKRLPVTREWMDKYRDKWENCNDSSKMKKAFLDIDKIFLKTSPLNPEPEIDFIKKIFLNPDQYVIDLEATGTPPAFSRNPFEVHFDALKIFIESTKHL